MTERIAIVGSREWGGRWEEIRQAVDDLVRSLPADAVVVSGGAAGVDLAARLSAECHGRAYVEHLPDWERNGRSAGFIRNEAIVRDCDRVIAFHNGTSKGTADTIERARRAGKPCEVRT